MTRVAAQPGPKAGTILSGRLRIEGFIGQGSMGIVLEATDLRTQQRVAVKIMAPERAKSDEARKRFLREARAAVQLSSEHITRLLDVGELHDGTPYLVMEYLDGCTLEAILVRDGPPAVDVVIDWILQALDGVAEAHRAGFVHRDLKPENLFLCERPGKPPIVKVLDFGTVKDLLTKGTKLTRTGSTLGSPAYMPPEQVRADEIDQRADVWAMGVTLYELTTGRLPFGGESIPQTLTAILRDQPVPLRARRPDAPPALEALISCALSKDPAGRYASANELLAALSTVRARLPGTTRVTKTVNLGTNFRLSRPDELADTADLQYMAEGTDTSRVRPRVILHEQQNFGATQQQASPRKGASRVILPIVLLAAAIVLMLIAGVVLRRRLAQRTTSVPVATSQEAPSTPASAPSAASPSAATPLSSSSVHPSASSAVSPPRRSSPPPRHRK